MVIPLLTQIVEQIKILPDDLQYQVLEFVRTLHKSSQEGIPGSRLLRFAGSIPPESVEEMRQAIESGCEQVDWNEW